MGMDVLEGLRGGNFREAVNAGAKRIGSCFSGDWDLANPGEAAILRVGDVMARLDSSAFTCTNPETLLPVCGSCRSNPDSTPSAEGAGGQPRSVQAESRTASSECWSLDMISQLPGARR